MTAELWLCLCLCLGWVLMLSKVLYGSLSDTLGSRWANWSVYAVFLTGFSLCCLAPSGSIPLAFAAFVFTALGMPLSSVSLSVWAGDLSAGPDYDRLVKWLSSAYMLGSLLTGPMPGMLADRFGSYVPAYLLFLASLVCSMAPDPGGVLQAGCWETPLKILILQAGPRARFFMGSGPSPTGQWRRPPPRSGIRTSPAWGS